MSWLTRLFHLHRQNVPFGQITGSRARVNCSIRCDSFSTVLLLALLGVFVFRERLNSFEVVGMVFAVISIFLLSRFGS